MSVELWNMYFTGITYIDDDMDNWESSLHIASFSLLPRTVFVQAVCLPCIPWVNSVY